MTIAALAGLAIYMAHEVVKWRDRAERAQWWKERENDD